VNIEGLTPFEALDKVKSLREAWRACNGALYKNVAVGHMQDFLEECIAEWGQRFMDCVEHELLVAIYGKHACSSDPDRGKRELVFGEGAARAEHKPKNHCRSCICGKRAPVQGDRSTPKKGRKRGDGSITWQEHLEAYAVYSARQGRSQSAEVIAERHGFGYDELTKYLGHEPKTWEPR
jgi:hypothetical protein